MSKNNFVQEQDINDIEEISHNDNYDFTDREILQDLDNKIHDSCMNTILYIKEYVKENAIPVAQFLNITDLYDFVDLK